MKSKKLATILMAGTLAIAPAMTGCELYDRPAPLTYQDCNQYLIIKSMGKTTIHLGVYEKSSGSPAEYRTLCGMYQYQVNAYDYETGTYYEDVSLPKSPWTLESFITIPDEYTDVEKCENCQKRMTPKEEPEPEVLPF